METYGLAILIAGSNLDNNYKNMKVIIGNKVIDSDKEPVMVLLSDRDKLNIMAMQPDADTYLSFPNRPEYLENDHAKVKVFMEDAKALLNPQAQEPPKGDSKKRKKRRKKS